MNIGILGTGSVGKTLGTGLVRLGHTVKLGSRTPGKTEINEWMEKTGEKASQGTLAESARFGTMLFLCTRGEGALTAVQAAGPANFRAKVLVDITNPLDFSKGMPPTLLPQFANATSLGEEVQRALPDARVVKTLNIVNCEVMVDPAKSGGEPTMFVCGNDTAAKTAVTEILKSFGWKDIIDIGDISGARSLEMMLPLWLRLSMAMKNRYVAFKAIR